MSAPWMPLYVADYIADTGHLSAAEHGAYMLILMAMWQNGGTLPDDDARLSRIARMDLRKWRKVAPTIRGLLTREGGLLTQKRLKFEFEIATGKRGRPSAPRQAIPLDVRRLVIERDGNVCRYCGSACETFDLDHIIPWSRGGLNAADNLTVACTSCNRSKGALTPEEWMS